MDKSEKKALLYGLGSLLVGTIIRSAARKVWHSTQGSPAPDNPSDPEVNTTHAMLWTVSLAVLSGFGKMIYRSAFSSQLDEAAETTPLLPEDET